MEVHRLFLFNFDKSKPMLWGWLRLVCKEVKHWKATNNLFNCRETSNQTVISGEKNKLRLKNWSKIFFLGNFERVVCDPVSRRVKCFHPSSVSVPSWQPVHLWFAPCEWVSSQCFDPPCCYNEPIWHWLNSRWHIQQALLLFKGSGNISFNLCKTSFIDVCLRLIHPPFKAVFILY